MAASSSSSAAPAAPALAFYLYDANFNRVALVGLPTPQPPLVLYQGTYYVWSDIHWAYFPATPYTASVSVLPQASVLANPQF